MQNFSHIKKKILDGTCPDSDIVVWFIYLNMTGTIKMNELTINISKDFSKYIGGREKKISQFSGEEFREVFFDDNFEDYDRVTFELDGVLGYPWDFLDEVFGSLARQYGKEKFWDKIRLVSAHDYVTNKIEYIVNHSEKEE